MFRHILTIIWNNRRHNGWLIAGLFVMSTCMWYAVDYVYTVTVNQTRPLGFDWHNVYALNIGVLTPESHKFLSDKLHTKNATGDFYTFMDRLEHHPAVESVCYTRMHKHYVWTNQGASLIYDTITCNSWMRTVSSGYFRVFRVKGADGSSPEQLAGRANLTDIIITDNLACQLFPGRSAVGEWVKNTLNGDSVRIAAVCENQKYNEFTSHQRATYIPLHFTQKRPFYYLEAPYLGVYIRVHPDSDGDDFIRRFRKDMREQLMIGNFYLEDMRPMTDFRNEQLKEPRNDLYTYLSMAVFFLLNAFLAVLGTFWFRTQQRRSELGLRVALGGSRVSLCRLLWGEGVVLLTLAFIPAIVVAANLGLAEIVSDYPVEFTLFRFVAGIFITYLLLVFTVFLAVWIPARQAMKIQPAEALREE